MSLQREDRDRLQRDQERELVPVRVRRRALIQMREHESKEDVKDIDPRWRCTGAHKWR